MSSSELLGDMRLKNKPNSTDQAMNDSLLYQQT